MRVGIVVGVLAASILTASTAGCTTTASVPERTGSTSPSVGSPSPSPDDGAASTGDPQAEWRSAIETTESRSGVLLEAQLLTNVEGFERIVSGDGYVDLRTGFGDIAWTDELGSSRELISEGGRFLEIDGTWFRIEREGSLPTTVAFDPLAGLTGATDVVFSGTQDVLGVATRRFDADLDPALGASIMGFSEEELSVFPPTLDGSLVATIWVDDSGRILRVLREFEATSVDGAPITASTLFLFDEWGVRRELSTPQDALPAPV